MPARILRRSIFFTSLALVGCGENANVIASATDDGGLTGTGGAVGTGGAAGSGGAVGSGGNLTTGGAPGSGGGIATGGAPGSGGGVGTGEAAAVRPAAPIRRTGPILRAATSHAPSA